MWTEEIYCPVETPVSRSVFGVLVCGGELNPPTCGAVSECHFSLFNCWSDGDVQEESLSQQPQHVASALVNTSPKVPRVELPNTAQPVQPPRPERFDVTLQRKDNEGFGFVILTSKTRPPPGGETQQPMPS